MLETIVEEFEENRPLDFISREVDIFVKDYKHKSRILVDSRFSLD